MGLSTAFVEALRSAIMPDIKQQFRGLLLEIRDLKKTIASLEEEIDFIKNPDRLLNKKKAAELLGISTRQVERLVSNGDLQPFSLGKADSKDRRTYFRRIDVLRVWKRRGEKAS